MLKKDSTKKTRKLDINLPIPKTKTQWIIAGIIMSIMLAIAAFMVYWFVIKDKNKHEVIRPAIEEPIKDPQPKPIYSKVSGRVVAEEVNKRPIYAVQIENSPEARPQSGLSDADIVSEAIAEGGITRFNAIYHDKTPPSLGPIRSLRPYYIDWFLPYDAAIVHAGGSGEALNDVRTLGLKDIDHGNSAGIFERLTKKYAPHNLYSSGQKVSDLMSQRGYTSNVTTSLARKEPKALDTPTAKTVSLNISRKLYNVDFYYNPETNSYLRNLNGMAHIDAGVDKQISPDVIIVPVMGRRMHPDRVHTQYDTVGSNKVFVFQDGGVIEGTWTKQSRQAQWEIKDNEGNTIALNPGQKWFVMIESADRVSYKP